MNNHRYATGERYPPAPWRFRGGAWVGLFLADRPLLPPAALKYVLPSRLVVVALIRYREGTLQYDELIIGALARRRLSVGLHVHHIWVDDTQSFAGGRQIWGLPKEFASFTWVGPTVHVADAAGPILTLRIDPRTALLPRLPLPVPFLGYVDNRWVYTIGSAVARLGRAGMHLSSWAERFPYALGTEPLLAIAMKPFRMRLPEPR